MKQQTEEIAIKCLGFEFKAKNPGRNTRQLVLIIVTFLLAMAILFKTSAKNNTEKTTNNKRPTTGMLLNQIRAP
jgi:hypothetical protein